MITRSPVEQKGLERGDSAPISIRGISFSYGRGSGPLFRDFSWDVLSGCTLLLGPNGAGKSTLLQLMAGLRRPIRGTIKRPHEDGAMGGKAARPGRVLGYLPQHSPRVSGLRVCEQVEYAAWLADVPRAQRSASVSEALRSVNLLEDAQRKVSVLSGGQARRLNVACALVHRPPILLLDEPTTGLDPVEREHLTEIISACKHDGRAIVVATHEADVIMPAVDRVHVLVDGALGAALDPVKESWLEAYRRAVAMQETPRIQ